MEAKLPPRLPLVTFDECMISSISGTELWHSSMTVCGTWTANAPLLPPLEDAPKLAEYGSNAYFKTRPRSVVFQRRESCHERIFALIIKDRRKRCLRSFDRHIHPQSTPLEHNTVPPYRLLRSYELMAPATNRAVWPQAPIQQEVKDLIYRFFALVDQNRTGVGEELASQVFTSDGVFAGTVGRFTGTAGICRPRI